MIQLRNPSTVLIGKSLRKWASLKNLKGNTVYSSDQQMHNVYINNNFVSTPTCFNASASSSGSLNLVLS
jgi:hypothetical protein